MICTKSYYDIVIIIICLKSNSLLLNLHEQLNFNDYPCNAIANKIFLIKLMFNIHLSVD